MAKKLVKKKAAVAKRPAAKKAPSKTPAKAAKSGSPKKKAPAKNVAAKDAPVKKKVVKRVRTTKEVRLKAFWGVFNQSLRRVAIYEFNDRKAADKKAAELTKSGKSPHFVQPVKEQIVE